MYRFSRNIYRDLAPRIDAKNMTGRSTARHRILEAGEATMRRLAYDRRYFARPARSLFGEIREEFALSDQVHVYMVIERHVNLALEHLERMPDEIRLDGQLRNCHASTREGTPCQRQPLPGRDHCPSHKHLEEPAEVGQAALSA
jgi:hypothetical protein